MLLDRPLRPARHGPPAGPPGQGVETSARGWDADPRCVAGTAHSDGPRAKGDESHGAGPGSDDVHISGPGAPPVADLGGYEGVRQAPLPGPPRSPRPAYSAKRWRTLPNSSPPHRSRRRRFVTSCPGGRCCLQPHRRLQPPPPARRRRPPSCGLHLRSSSATTAAFTMAAAWSWPQESGAARLRPCQACKVPG